MILTVRWKDSVGNDAECFAWSASINGNLQGVWHWPSSVLYRFTPDPDLDPACRPDSRVVSLGRWATLGCGLFATGMALWIASLDTKSLWDQSVRLLALFGGAIPGVFALGMLTRRANARGVIIGAVASIAATVGVQNFTDINSFFHAFLAFVTSIIVGYAASLWPRQPPTSAQLHNLTVWDLGPSSSPK